MANAGVGNCCWTWARTAFYFLGGLRSEARSAR